MQIVIELHKKNKVRYYLGEGDKEGKDHCKWVLRYIHLLARQTPETFYCDSALVMHEEFHQIKEHLDQIMIFYVSRETELIQEFVRRLLPTNPNPLRFIVLSSMSLFTARVYLHRKELQPDPIQTYVDGHFNLVIDLKQNVVRIPLIPDATTHTVATVPPTLRFKGINEDDEKRMKDFVFKEAPVNGRKTQLSAFISVLNSNRPATDYITSFRNSLTGIDMSFSTAICMLARGAADFPALSNLFQVLGCDQALDLFLRELSVASLSVVQGFQVHTSVNLIALTNFFLSVCGDWTSKVHMSKGIVQMLRDICLSIHHRFIPNEALYILRAALVAAAYDDSKGLSALSMFLELTARPFATASQNIDQFEALKKGFLFGDPTLCEAKKHVEQTIVEIMGSEIKVAFSPSRVNAELREIHKYVMSRLDDFIETVIALNQRTKLEHPAMQMMVYSYQMAVKHGLIE
jgi:hypothetical protein